PGMASRIANHIDFPDYNADELVKIANLMVETMQYRLEPKAEAALKEYIERRMQQPRFSNARSIRNALDRPRLRPANRLVADRGALLDRDALQTISESDIRASRVFTQ